LTRFLAVVPGVAGSSAKTERRIRSECFVASEPQWLHQQIWRASVSLATSWFSSGKWRFIVC